MPSRVGACCSGSARGWNREEMENHGTDPRRRFRRMRESIEAMKAIWTQDEAEYHGELVDFDPIWCWPKPARKPHPPVLVGGTGEKVLDRVLAYGDEWMPNRVTDPDALATRIEELRDRAGRQVPVSVFGAKPDAGFLERLAAVGVHRAYLYLTPREPEAVERQLDEFTQVPLMGAPVRLPDGRVLGVDRLGRPGGVPVLAFHGMPGSRLDFLSESLECAQAGVELIAVDRPGFGLSSPQPGRVLLDWAGDVAALADALGLERFAVLGYSAGAKYALACAYALPERVQVAGVLSGSGPPEMPGWEEGMIAPERLLQWASLHAQPLARACWALLGVLARRLPGPSWRASRAASAVRTACSRTSRACARRCSRACARVSARAAPRPSRTTRSRAAPGGSIRLASGFPCCSGTASATTRCRSRTRAGSPTASRTRG